MGCDSHVHIEVKGGNHRWGLRDDENRYWKMMEKEDLSFEDRDARTPYAVKFLGSRNYRLFAALADVRNHGDGITPLFPLRGVPDDLSAPVKKYNSDWGGDLHSHTYFTLQELMAADLDANCCQLEVSLFPLQYAHWKDTGKLSDDVMEAWEVKNLTQDPFHREVGEDEMLLLLASGDPKSLTKKCDKLYARSKQRKVVGGPYVKLYVPVSYRQILPGFDKLIESLKEYGPPDRVRVVMSFDN